MVRCFHAQRFEAGASVSLTEEDERHSHLAVQELIKRNRGSMVHL